MLNLPLQLPFVFREIFAVAGQRFYRLTRFLRRSWGDRIAL